MRKLRCFTFVIASIIIFLTFTYTPVLSYLKTSTAGNSISIGASDININVDEIGKVENLMPGDISKKLNKSVEFIENKSSQDIIVEISFKEALTASISKNFTKDDITGFLDDYNYINDSKVYQVSAKRVNEILRLFIDDTTTDFVLIDGNYYACVKAKTNYTRIGDICIQALPELGGGVKKEDGTYSSSRIFEQRLNISVSIDVKVSSNSRENATAAFGEIVTSKMPEYFFNN